MTTSEKLTAAAENVPKVYHAGQWNVIRNAAALKGSACGPFLFLEDVSPVRHTLKIRVHGKNLFDKTKLKVGEAYHSKDLIQTDNGFSFKRTGTEVASGAVVKLDLVRGTYHIKAECTQSDGLDGGFGVWDPVGKVWLARAMFTGSAERTFTVTTAGKVQINFYCNTNSPADTTVTYSQVQIEPGETATAYEAYSRPTGLNIRRYGANLAKFEMGYASHGGSVTSTVVTGKGAGNASYSLVRVTEGMTYYIKKASILTGAGSRFFWFTQNPIEHLETAVSIGGEYYLNQAYSAEAKAPANAKWLFIRWSVDETVYPTQNPCVVMKQTVGYEPYVESVKYEVSGDGTVAGVESAYPTTTLIADKPGVFIDCEYYKDIDKAFNELTTSVALSGGN